jgi:hypothetical protein
MEINGIESNKGLTRAFFVLTRRTFFELTSSKKRKEGNLE